MFFAWLKKYMPRGLYGRAALILLVPVVVIQLVVLVAFSQRYFDTVTRQLMRGVVAETNLYSDAIERFSGEDLAGALDVLDKRLGMESSLDVFKNPIETRRDWFDFSAFFIAQSLEEGVEGFEGVDLVTSPRYVRFSMMTEGGRLVLQMPRSRASAINPHQLLVWMVFTGVVMTLVAIIFLRNQMRPIRKLAFAAEAFGRGEVVPYRPSGAIEVRSAGAAFINMRNRIERQIEQRTLMLSGVSHDLRTPLTRIRLNLSMIEMEPDLEQEVSEIKRDLDEMEQLVDAFLAFVRSDSVEESEEIDAVQLLHETRDKAARGGAMVEIAAIPDGPVMMTARPQSLSRALDNLCSNAARYGTHVRLSLGVYDRAVVFSVEDDGPGIAEEDRESALQPFVRLDAARNQDRGTGVGLGLAIAFDVARRHGGTLRLDQSPTLGGLKADLVIARRSDMGL